MTGWLIDKSAAVRLSSSPDGETWLDRIRRGLVRISTVTQLELGFSARSVADHHWIFEESPLTLMPVEYLTPAMEGRAVAVQRVLAERGLHRAPSIPDLLVAATAELARLTVLHLDKDFELIAEFTGQSQERLRLE